MSGDDRSKNLPYRTQGGFTLVESMLAVLILGLLACAATLSLSRPLADAEARETFSLLSSSDHWSRQAARDAGKPVRLVIDPTNATVARFEGAGLRERRTLLNIPRHCSVREIRVGRNSWSDQAVTVDFSASGYSPSYALRLHTETVDWWLVFAGMTGQVTKVSDEATADAMLGAQHAPSQNGAARDDAD
jgi:prepilin-type N-terminal cleavage/methylation domain-containing protein